MYAYLKGTLEEIAEDAVVVEVGNIGYNVRVSATTAQGLPGIGSEVKIYTYTLVREDAFTLYGFLTKDDLEIFKKLITVNGIGPKGGLAILSVMNADALRFAIMAGDAKSIAKAPGVGNKTAERVILDLRDKISLEDTLRADAGEIRADASVSDSVRESVEALTALGYGMTEATRAVKAVKDAEQMAVEDILKASLKHLI